MDEKIMTAEITVTNHVFDVDYERKRNKRYSKKQERRLAKLSGGSRVPLSGAGEKAKGDVKTELELVEAKWTNKKSIKIEREWLEKIAIEAMSEGKVPGLSITFLEWDKVYSVVPKDWIMVPAQYFWRVTNGEKG